MQYMPTHIKSRGYYFESREDGRWNLRGRGQRRIVDFDEMQNLLQGVRRPKPTAPSK